MPMPLAKQIKKMVVEESEANPHLPMRFAIEKVIEREGFSAIDILAAMFDPEGSDAASQMTDADIAATEGLLGDADKKAKKAVEDDAEKKSSDEKLAADKKAEDEAKADQEALARDAEARRIQGERVAEGGGPTDPVGNLTEGARVEPGTERAAELQKHQGVATADAAGNTPGPKSESAHDKHATKPGNQANQQQFGNQGAKDGGKTGENTPMSKEVASENKLAGVMKKEK